MEAHNVKRETGGAGCPQCSKKTRAVDLPVNGRVQKRQNQILLGGAG